MSAIKDFFISIRSRSYIKSKYAGYSLKYTYMHSTVTSKLFFPDQCVCMCRLCMARRPHTEWAQHAWCWCCRTIRVCSKSQTETCQLQAFKLSNVRYLCNFENYGGISYAPQKLCHFIFFPFFFFSPTILTTTLQKPLSLGNLSAVSFLTCNSRHSC